MRRAVTSLLAAVALAAPLGLALPAVATAQECEGYGCAHANYERTRTLPAYGSRYDGYWDRQGESRRDYGHHRHYRRDRDHHGGAYYYPGYGYYAGRAGHRDGRPEYRDGGYRDGGYRDGGYREGRDGRAADCAQRYRSYDWNSGTYVGYDGVRRHCG